MNKIHAFVGTTLSLLLFNCGGGDNEYFAPQYNAYAYSAKAHPNLECALALDASDESRLCSLGKLPLIGTETTNPSKQDIKNRVLVSHDWMGDRFMALLDEMPDDLRLMLRSVTAIVITDNIRPSFYTTETGAIYLDPEGLWLTQEEREVISKADDYRSGFGDGLNFTGLWRYLKPDGTWARTPSYNRTLEDLTFPLARLLYHELAHANTFLPPGTHASINPAHKVYEAASDFIDQNASLQLETNLPLQSQVMKDLAYVLFRGKAPTSEQVSLSPIQVGAAFASDRANDDYAYVPYSDELYYEDVAMLLEELMSKYHFNYNREIAFTNSASSIYCNDYYIQWGQTGRIGNSNVKEAARLAVQALIPELDLDAYIDALAAPAQSATGANWCGPLELEAKSLSKGKVSGQKTTFDPQQVNISKNFRPPHFH